MIEVRQRGSGQLLLGVKARTLCRAKLRGAVLRGADLYAADLRGADLAGAVLSGADLYTAQLQGASLARADLARANLSAARLGAADLREANLTEACLDCADLTGADLQAANLTSASLIYAVLRQVDLCGADLRGANLGRAVLEVAWCDPSTRWPEGFDPRPHGARLVDTLIRRTVRKLSRALVREKRFTPIEQVALPQLKAFPREEYAFIGIRRWYWGSVVSAALVEADGLGEEEVARHGERFFHLVQLLQQSASQGRLSSSGVLCFVLEKPPTQAVVELVQRQKRLSLGSKCYSLCWVIDAGEGRVYPHRGVPLMGAYPGKKYLEAVLAR